MKIEITAQHISDLQGEALRTYLWFAITCPAYGMEITHKELSDNLQVSSRTIQRSVYELVDKGYLGREYQKGFIPTYTVLK